MTSKSVLGRVVGTIAALVLTATLAGTGVGTTQAVEDTGWPCNDCRPMTVGGTASA
jgi:hypothetical protein